MYFRFLADSVVLTHLAFIVFVISGGFIAWRHRSALLVHVPALIWGLWIEWSGWICPLTPLENHLRERAGESGYGGGFIEHYIIPVIYPPGLTHGMQWLLGAALLAVNAVAYGRLVVGYLSRVRQR